jgi:hypothetical protein
VAGGCIHFRQVVQADPNSKQVQYLCGLALAEEAQRGDGPFTGGRANQPPKRRSPSKPCGGPDASGSVGRSRGALPGSRKVATLKLSRNADSDDSAGHPELITPPVPINVGRVACARWLGYVSHDLVGRSSGSAVHCAALA